MSQEELPQPRFQPGDYVRRKTAPDKAGSIRRQEWHGQSGEWWYLVNFSGRLESAAQTDLEDVPESEDPWDQLSAGRLASVSAFHVAMAFERLARPPSRIAESFGTARATIYPFQFKPLLKFLESPRKRLLIADEVGLGKTIEAAYILRELRAHVPLERTLIVVPARLRPKWRDELERRFDEHFELVDLASIRDRFIRPVEGGRDPGAFAWIASYETVRSPDFTRFLREYSPPIDLVILDEAHRTRNPESQQHRVASELAECADSLLLLTATPVQAGGNQDYFQLLRLLDANTFATLPTFERQLEANRPIVRALDAVRKYPPAAGAAAQDLLRLAENELTVGLTRGDYFQSIVERTQAAGSLPRDELVELQQDIAELSLTGTVVSRTRKADVLAKRPARDPQSVMFEMTEEEDRFYNAVALLIQLTKPQESDWAATMVCLMYYRCAASCIPAAVAYFEAELEKLGPDLRSLIQDELEGAIDTETSPAVSSISPAEGGSLYEVRRRLAEVLATSRPPTGIDTKFDLFWRSVGEVWRQDKEQRRPWRKVIVFSYFKRTLAYLTTRLQALGEEHRLINGDIPIPEREGLIEEFLEKDNVRILLSSEVGGEGLDLQKASVVVNYDLPWNPMVVEQRIGRVDRLGQRSEKITIVNLVAKGTIEAEILHRLYERLKIFREALGEIEPILGEQIEELTVHKLRGRLTPEEEERRLRSLERVIAQNANDAIRLANESDRLIAADQAFLDEVEALVGRRKVPDSRELHRFLDFFLSTNYRGAELPRESIEAVAPVVLPREMASEIQSRFLADIGTRRVASRIAEGAFPATFNPDAVLEHPRAELITARHPVIRFAVDEISRSPIAHRAFALGVPPVPGVREGWWVFSVRQLDVRGTRNRVDLVPLVCHMESGEIPDLEASYRLFSAMLENGHELLRDVPKPHEVRAAVLALSERASDLKQEKSDRERRLNAVRASRLRATEEAILRMRLESAQRLLDSHRARGARDHAIRSAEGRLEAARRRLAAHFQKAGAEEKFGLTEIHVACGLIAVGLES